jgi:hypothetical protein
VTTRSDVQAGGQVPGGVPASPRSAAVVAAPCGVLRGPICAETWAGDSAVAAQLKHAGLAPLIHVEPFPSHTLILSHQACLYQQVWYARSRTEKVSVL